jgi:hypothetical protein
MTLTSPVQAQSNATDSTFFPMHQGNRWVFETIYINHGSWPPQVNRYYHILEITSPVMQVGNVYSMLYDENSPGNVAPISLVCNDLACRDSVWIDYHADTQKLFYRYLGNEVLVMDFGLDVGDSLLVTGDLDNPYWTMSHKVTFRGLVEYNGNTINRITVQKSFPYLGEYDYYETRSSSDYYRGLGKSTISSCGGCNSFSGPTLIAAQINGEVLFGDITVSNEDDRAGTPEAFRLDTAYPNPFNPTTTLRFALAQSGEVSLAVYDVLGRQIHTQKLGALHAGEHHHALDMSGHPSGTYLVRLQSGGQVRSIRITLVK